MVAKGDGCNRVGAGVCYRHSGLEKLPEEFWVIASEWARGGKWGIAGRKTGLNSQVVNVKRAPLPSHWHQALGAPQWRLRLELVRGGASGKEGSMIRLE